MASWLGHKFAKGLQTKVFAVATIFGASILGSSAVHDAMVSELDYMDNPSDATTVQMFEDKIETLTTLGTEYTDLRKQREQAYLADENPETVVADLQKKMDSLSSDTTQLSNRVERELYLNQALGEDDFEDLAELFNTAISSDKINTDGADVLQECQLGTSSVQNRDLQKNAVKDCMDIKAPLLDDPLVFMFSVFGAMMTTGLGLATVSGARSMSYNASRNNPGAPRIVQAAQNAVSNRHRKKSRKLN